jgi:hypothetical protein
MDPATQPAFGHRGQIADCVILVIAAAACDSILGDNTGYCLGRKLGYPLLLKHSPAIGLTEARIKLGLSLGVGQGHRRRLGMVCDGIRAFG